MIQKEVRSWTLKARRVYNTTIQPSGSRDFNIAAIVDVGNPRLRTLVVPAAFMLVSIVIIVAVPMGNEG